MYRIEDFRPQGVVIDAGEFPNNPIATQWLGRCDKIVCCDGAANRYLATSFPKPWRIVGDCDSLRPELREEYKEIVVRIPDQETNDQTKAVNYLAARGASRIVILGATGLREDHTLGNIALLTEYLKRGIEARIYTDYGVFIPVCGEAEVACMPGTQVSIFNCGATGLRAEGLKYPLRDFDSWWQGTLNQADGSRFRIDAEGEYLLFLNYPQNGAGSSKQ